MRKLKPKYKYADKKKHFLIIRQDKELAKCFIDNLGKYQFYWLMHLNVLKSILP